MSKGKAPAADVEKKTLDKDLLGEVPETTRQCNTCGGVKLAGEFWRGNLCKECRNKSRRVAEPRAAGRPRRTVKIGKMSGVKGRRSGAGLFGNRGSLEDYLRVELGKSAGDYDDMIEGFKVLREAAVKGGILAEAARAQAGIQRAVSDKQEFMVTLVKKFGLLSGLHMATEDDPKFTPVELVLAFEPPEEAIVEPVFTLGDDDVQPV